MKSNEETKAGITSFYKIINYQDMIGRQKSVLQEKQNNLLALYDDANEDFSLTQFEECQKDIKNTIKSQRGIIKSSRPDIEGYVEQKRREQKHKVLTWLKSCVRKPFPTWRDDTGELMCIVAGLLFAWAVRFLSFGADSDIGMRACIMFGGICGFCLSIPSAIKAFCYKNGCRFGVFNFFAELIILIGSIIWLCLY